MKISFNLNEGLSSKVKFTGGKFTKDDNGFKNFEFSYPFDPNKYECYIEFYYLDKDQYNNYFTVGKAFNRDNLSQIKVNPGKNSIDLSQDLGISDSSPFAYHYILKDKNGNQKVRVDAGDVIDERANKTNESIYNVVSPNQSYIDKGGSMKLVIVDSQNVGYVYNDKNLYVEDTKLKLRAQNGIKTLMNKFGGTLAGMEKSLDDGSFDSYSRIISLPLFTDDDFTAHGYWNKNCFQMVKSFGNINNYANFQKKLLSHGINFVSDGAFVNEGLDGIHFKNVLKYGEESPFYYWFNASGLKDGPLSLGVLSKNKDFISHKLVNSPYKYSQDSDGQISISKNSQYDNKKPTYLQIFDKRLVTNDEAKNDKHLIKSYSKMTTQNIYSLHSHNDSIFPYYFEINPDFYNKTIKQINKYNKSDNNTQIKYGDFVSTKLLTTQENFVIDGKFEGGFDTWDANPDIAKLSFLTSNADEKYLKNISMKNRNKIRENMLRGNYQVQDYAVLSGVYWTKLTDDILRMHISQNLKHIDNKNPKNVYNQILGLVEAGVLPIETKTKINKNEVNNILNNAYNNKRILPQGNKSDIIIAGLMSLPLDSIEFGDSVTGLLSSPYISKRANTEGEIGLSRFDIYKKGNKNLPDNYKKTYEFMDKLYTHEMYIVANNIINKVNDKLPIDCKIFDEKNKVTEYGRYVLPLLLPQITKYIMVKALAPDNKIKVSNNGEITYDYKALNNVTMQYIGLSNSSSFENDSLYLLNKIKNGISKFSNDDEIVNALFKSIEGTNVNSFKLADLIIDKIQIGLDWRIDATKDVANVEALRNGNTSFDFTWQSISEFWKNFGHNVLKINPNAYLVAEVTNEMELHDRGFGYKSSKYPSKNDIIPKFLRDTGMVSIANYSAFFRNISKLFTRDFEDGSIYEDMTNRNEFVYNTFINNGYIHSGGSNSLIYSYTFIDNHDKPRALHCAALDMGLFTADLKNDVPFEYKKTAYKILNDKTFNDNITDDEINNFDYSKVSWKAIAMADALRHSFINQINDYNYFNHYNQADYEKMLSDICKTIRDLANGKYLDERFDPESFGVKPFDKNIEMIISHAKAMYGFSIPGVSDKQFSDDVFEKSLKPALSRLKGMMKYLVALPGLPTLFDGDDYGVTGWDSKTKNMTVLCRQNTHPEWINPGDKYKEFIKKHNKELDDIMALRKNPNCEALNNGAIYTLPRNRTQKGNLISSLLRQSTNGKMAISIFNPNGVNYNYKDEYIPQTIYVDKLYIGDENKFSNEGVPGLREGLKFVNANDKNDIYYTRDYDNSYYLVRHCNGKDVPIKISDTTLVLYHVPENHENLMSLNSPDKLNVPLNFIVDTYSNKEPIKDDLLCLV